MDPVEDRLLQMQVEEALPLHVVWHQTPQPACSRAIVGALLIADRRLIRIFSR